MKMRWGLEGWLPAQGLPQLLEVGLVQVPLVTVMGGGSIRGMTEARQECQQGWQGQVNLATEGGGVYDVQLEARCKAGNMGDNRNRSRRPTLQTRSNRSPTLRMIPGQKCKTVQVW